MDNNENISESKDIAESLNDFFIKSVDNLDIEPFIQRTLGNNSERSVLEIIQDYESHPSIKRIKAHFHVKEIFTFRKISTEDLKTKLANINTKKASVPNGIPPKVLVSSNEIVSEYLAEIYNNSENKCIFPQTLKLANIIPVHKKGAVTSMKNYRPISLLPIISKIFEKHMYSQILIYIEKFLSPSLFGFRKGHSTEHCLLRMLELWKKALDKKKVAGAILTDLSKAFDCLNHELLIAKLSAYGFDDDSLKFIYSYLKGRKQRTKVGSSLSSWMVVKRGVPHRSILGPLLFNIVLDDIFLFNYKVNKANYADDNTPIL